MKIIDKLSSLFKKYTSKKTVKGSRRYNRKPDLKIDSDPQYHQTFKVAFSLLPAKVDLRPNMPPVYNQGDIGSCTGNASAAAFEYLQLQELSTKTSGVEIFDPKQYTPVSRLFIYYNERKLNKQTSEDAGATLRDSVLSLLYWGACKEISWSYKDSNAFVEPTKDSYDEASLHKISKYYRFADLDHVKHSLAAGFPVIIGISVYESFESEEVARTGYVPIPNPSEQCMGGHAVCVVGYDDSRNVLIVRNSWGADWGDKGYFYLPYSFFQNPNLSDDWWTIRK